MCNSLFYRIISPFILVIFTITSCNYFAMPEPDTMTVPIGKGDIRFVYLDDDYKPTTNDTGKMGMYIDNNELAQGVLVISEIPDNNIDNDVVVRVINKNNSSLVSFFYYSGQIFPHKIAITIDGEDVIGKFSMYNNIKETYSVEFNNEEGETEKYKDLILNKNVFSLHKNDDNLTETQNLRIRNIITTLCLWNSLALQIDTDFDIGGRFISWKKVKSVLQAVLPVVAVVALIVAVVIAVPAAVIVSGPILILSGITTGAAIAAGISIAAAAGALILDIFDTEPKGPHGTEPNKDARSMVEITLSGVKIENNKMPPYYLEYGESLTFNINVIQPNGREFSDLIDIDNIFIAYDPNHKMQIAMSDPNARYFDITSESNDTDSITLTVQKNSRTGSDENGNVQFVIQFKQNVIINNNSKGIDFMGQPRGNMFILNFTVLLNEPIRIDMVSGLFPICIIPNF